MLLSRMAEEFPECFLQPDEDKDSTRAVKTASQSGRARVREVGLGMREKGESHEHDNR